MQKISGLYVLGNLSYSPPRTQNWMCVEDPFLQIQSHIENYLSQHCQDPAGCFSQNCMLPDLIQNNFSCPQIPQQGMFSVAQYIKLGMQFSARLQLSKAMHRSSHYVAVWYKVLFNANIKLIPLCQPPSLIFSESLPNHAVSKLDLCAVFTPLQQAKHPAIQL